MIYLRMNYLIKFLWVKIDISTNERSKIDFSTNERSKIDISTNERSKANASTNDYQKAGIITHLFVHTTITIPRHRRTARPISLAEAFSLHKSFADTRKRSLETRLTRLGNIQALVSVALKDLWERTWNRILW